MLVSMGYAAPFIFYVAKLITFIPRTRSNILWELAEIFFFFIGRSYPYIHNILKTLYIISSSKVGINTHFHNDE